MRQLTVRQKKLLDTVPMDCQDVDSLPEGIWEKLQAINDTEILWQEVNRYLTDRYYKHEFRS